MNRPIVIKYSEEEDPPIDESFLRVHGTISRYTRPIKKHRRKPKKKIIKQNVDIYYL